MVDAVFDAFRGLPPALAVFLAAMLPVTELRGAIPLGIALLDQPAAATFVLALAGNVVPVVFFVVVLEPASSFVRNRWAFADRLFERIFGWFRARHSARFEHARDTALIAFVAVPLPGTGGWAGALAAFLFGVPRVRAIVLISIGLVISASVVTALVMTGTTLFGLTRP